ncbi:unnamed protein product [Boreogadus saida]
MATSKPINLKRRGPSEVPLSDLRRIESMTSNRPVHCGHLITREARRISSKGRAPGKRPGACRGSMGMLGPVPPARGPRGGGRPIGEPPGPPSDGPATTNTGPAHRCSRTAAGFAEGEMGGLRFRAGR